MVEHSKVIYEDEDHRCIWLSWDDPDSDVSLVQTNQLLVVNKGQGYLFDPGGAFIFSEVAVEVSKYLPLNQIRYLLATHQDPDVLSSLSQWLKATNARLLISRLWVRFVSHYFPWEPFGFTGDSRLIAIEDRGKKVVLPGGGEIHLLPAHYLHSEGNFCFYDTRSRILFSGDIGAAVFPKGERYMYVDDWNKHIPFTEGFHRRYMSNNKTLRKWVNMVRKYPVEMIVPQHGAIIRKDNIPAFLSWLENLECGTDLLPEVYGF